MALMKKLKTFISGQPVLVELSVSLRNILEIDEHRQVTIALFFFSNFLYRHNFQKCFLSLEPRKILLYEKKEK
jgi:hypothetical protein